MVSECDPHQKARQVDQAPARCQAVQHDMHLAQLGRWHPAGAAAQRCLAQTALEPCACPAAERTGLGEHPLHMRMRPLWVQQQLHAACQVDTQHVCVQWLATQAACSRRHGDETLH